MTSVTIFNGGQSAIVVHDGRKHWFESGALISSCSAFQVIPGFTPHTIVVDEQIVSGEVLRYEWTKPSQEGAYHSLLAILGRPKVVSMAVNGSKGFAEWVLS